jgi:hypothetical protein
LWRFQSQGGHVPEQSLIWQEVWGTGCASKPDEAEWSQPMAGSHVVDFFVPQFILLRYSQS